MNIKKRSPFLSLLLVLIIKRNLCYCFSPCLPKSVAIINNHQLADDSWKCDRKKTFFWFLSHCLVLFWKKRPHESCHWPTYPVQSHDCACVRDSQWERACVCVVGLFEWKIFRRVIIYKWRCERYHTIAIILFLSVWKQFLKMCVFKPVVSCSFFQWRKFKNLYIIRNGVMWRHFKTIFLLFCENYVVWK